VKKQEVVIGDRKWQVYSKSQQGTSFGADGGSKLGLVIEEKIFFFVACLCDTF
jgi:hypothetical protein